MKLKKVRSLMELLNKALSDAGYAKLIVCAAQNLGGSVKAGDIRGAHRVLEINAIETDEDGVVGEVNFCIPLIK